MARIISVMSGKGGVGKTTISVNLAASLSNLGENVLLVDADLETPCVSVHLGSPSIPITLTGAVKGKRNVRDAIYVHETGLRIVPSSLSLNQFSKTDIGRLGKALDSLKKKADIIIIDCPPGLGDIVKMLLRKSDQVLIVTNPELPAIADGIKAAKLAEQFKTTVLGIVVNKVTYSPDIETSATDVESLLDYPIISALPSDKSVKKALTTYIPTVTGEPNSKFSYRMNLLAAKLVGRSNEIQAPSKNIFSRLFNWRK